MKNNLIISLAFVFLVGCSTLSGIGSVFGEVGGSNEPQRELPIITAPDVEVTECKEGYVCFTEEDAVAYFSYVFTLEEAYEKAR